MTQDKTQHTMNFEMPENLWQRAKDEADRLGISVSALMKTALSNYLDSKIKGE